MLEYLRRHKFIAIVLAMIMCILIYLLYDRSRYVLIDNAQVKAELLSVRSEVDGRIETSLYNKNVKFVKKNDVIVTLSKDLSREDARRVEALIEERKLSLAQLGKEIQNELALNKLKLIQYSAEEKLKINEHAISNLVLSQSDDELKRFQALHSTGMVSEGQFANLKSKHKQYELLSKEKEISLSQILTKKKELELNEERIQLKKLSLARLSAEIDSLNSELNGMKIREERLSFRSYFDGVLDDVYVQPGEFIYAKQRLFTVHDPNFVYIEANIFESDLKFAQLNKYVKVKLDAFPNDTFDGRIVRIGSITGSEKSAIPASKVVSNFIRIRQLVPIRIELDKSLELMPGMMAEVYLPKSNTK